jgi:hypothetical protein
VLQDIVVVNCNFGAIKTKYIYGVLKRRVRVSGWVIVMTAGAGLEMVGQFLFDCDKCGVLGGTRVADGEVTSRAASRLNNRSLTGRGNERKWQTNCEVLKAFNPLKTKSRPLYLKAQSVPRCKHFSSRL